MNQSPESRRRQRRTNKDKPHHRFPVCPTTGKRRLGERKDVKLILRRAQEARARARIDGVRTNRHELRGYRCDACLGWHLTSMAQFVYRSDDLRGTRVGRGRRKRFGRF